LAQPVRGVTRSLIKIKVHSQEGDIVRLVVADDVRVNGMIVIPKGAVGQATVTKIELPELNPEGSYKKGDAVLLLVPQTGDVSLQLDWVEDVTGEDVPLRALPKGEGKPFVMMVLAEHGGMVVRPATLKSGLMGAATLGLIKGHLRPWAPTGSRITAFVDGATSIDLDKVKAAQQLLPVPNGNGILTIYRVKGDRAQQLEVFCDEKEIATLGEMQYVSLEITPGKHSCHIGEQKPFELTAEAGEQYFLQARHKSLRRGWELAAVGIDEGEDETANGAIVEEASAGQVTH
jgi:hypothetical protein